MIAKGFFLLCVVAVAQCVFMVPKRPIIKQGPTKIVKIPVMHKEIIPIVKRVEVPVYIDRPVQVPVYVDRQYPVPFGGSVGGGVGDGLGAGIGGGRGVGNVDVGINSNIHDADTVNIVANVDNNVNTGRGHGGWSSFDNNNNNNNNNNFDGFNNFDNNFDGFNNNNFDGFNNNNFDGFNNNNFDGFGGDHGFQGGAGVGTDTIILPGQTQIVGGQKGSKGPGKF